MKILQKILETMIIPILNHAQVQIKMELINQTEHQNEEVYYKYNNTFSQHGKQSNRYLRPSSHGGYRMRNQGNFQ